MKIKKLLSLLAVGVIATGLFAGCSNSNNENGATTEKPSTEESQEPVSYTHLTLPTSWMKCRSRWSPYH